MAGKPRADLTSRAWKAQCKRIKHRDGYRCTDCGSENDLTVDHIVPPSISGIPGDQYPDHMLTTLCRPCNSRKGKRLNTRPAYTNPKYA